MYLTDAVSTDAFAPSPRAGLKAAKLGVLRAMMASGFADRIRDSEWRRRRLLVLCYHGISLRDEHEWDPHLYLPVHALRGRFELLRREGYSVLPLREAVERLRSGNLPPRSVALTFDDGTWDFLYHVVPLLHEFQFPATVYITSYYSMLEAPVFRVALRYLLWRGRDRAISVDGLLPGSSVLDIQEERKREAVSEMIMAEVTRRGGGPEHEIDALQTLAKRTGVDWDEFVSGKQLRIMSANEIAALPGDLVDVQLHTHRHRTPLDRDDFHREIRENRQYLASIRPQQVFDGFCYPSGVTNERLLPWLAEEGIDVATTCRAGLATKSTNLLLCPRLVDTWLRDRLEFEGWLTGVASVIPRLPRRRRYRQPQEDLLRVP